ncbi:glycosyltransferase family 2 protein [Timonella sp. A28]|uniref:glycosyltransferase family 2 protein n=1 Tax=Timonella sp. A28 TaxID=3442640 RepID=UPI003EC0301D
MGRSTVDVLNFVAPHQAGTEELYVRTNGNVTETRGVYELAAGARIDLGTWFNAAPIAWWHQLFGSGPTELRVSGQGLVTVHTVNDKGEHLEVAQENIDGEWKFWLARSPHIRFAWITVEAQDNQSARLAEYSWHVPRKDQKNYRTDRKVTVVVPTFRREWDALDQAEYLLNESAQSFVGRVVLIDQGDTVRADPRFEPLQRQHEDRLVLLEQGNFGGSGGYARGMRESLRWNTDPVLLLDDDAHIDTESLRRAMEISGAVAHPTIIGTGLISAESHVELEAFAEGIARRPFQWGAIDRVTRTQSLVTGGPTQWNFLNPHVKPDYTGWWGTLLPEGAVEHLGLPAPFFIKWDDAEYGLRAGRQGIARAVVPGISVWHPTWAAKQTSASWSSWMMHRNRFAVAAEYGAGRGIIVDSLIHQIKHVLSLQYVTAELWINAVDEFVAGPQWISPDIVESRNKAQALIDALGQAEPHSEHSDVKESVPQHPWDVVTAISQIVYSSKKPKIRSVRASEFTWNTGLGVTEVLMTAEDNEAVTSVLRFDSHKARRLIATIVKQHWALFRTWKKTTDAYTTSKIQSVDVWETLLPVQKEN